MAKRPGPLLRALLRGPVFLYRWHMGWLLGHRFLLLIHVGRRTGRRHQTVLEVVHYDEAIPEAVVMSGWGASSDWYRNVRASGKSEVVIGHHRWGAAHRVLDEDEAVAVIEGYERHNRLLKPVIYRVLGALLGRRYDGSEQARRDLVRRLPLVGFRP